ncbi:DNA/RNA non-specific endonuclease [Streptomyces sp. NBC_01236]|nr:DNA/RNA non-specific endonuclease [Streptomyces sp. NBC_01236]
MYNGALADMGLGTDPYTGNRYAFTGGNPINRVEIDGHDSWFTDVLEKGEETVAKAATAAVESQASRSIWDTAKTAGKRNLVGGAISTVIDIWNGDDPLHALACSAGCRQMNTRSLTDRIRCSSQPREERYMYFPLMNGNATGATALMCPSDLKPPNSRSTEDVFTPQGFPGGVKDANGDYLFNRSHIIGDRFNGANIPENIFTGYRRFNVSGMKTCENRMAEALAAEPVTYGAVLEYGDPNNMDRPTAITMTASTPTRQLFSVRIENKNANGGGC